MPWWAGPQHKLQNKVYLKGVPQMDYSVFISFYQITAGMKSVFCVMYTNKLS